jgi:hypothetical protein
MSAHYMPRLPKFNAQSISLGLFWIAAYAVVAIVLVLLFINVFNIRSGSSSVEVAFADHSGKGLSIVPASCPSDPHYQGECEPPRPICPDEFPELRTGGCTCQDGSTPTWLARYYEYLFGTDPCPPPVTCVPNQGSACSSNPNQCGDRGTGIVQCDGSCNATVPPLPGSWFGFGGQCTCVFGEGSPCVSPPNSCGMTNPGTQLCNGSCSTITPPLNSLCPAQCPDGTPVPPGGCPTARTCPDGTPIPVGGVCPSTSLCPDGSVMPPSGICPGGTPGGCQPTAGQSCQSGPNRCGMRGVGVRACDGTCAASVPADSMCRNPDMLCWDGSEPDINGACPACPAGYTQQGNRCIPPDDPRFEPFVTPEGFTASGRLQVRPALVRSGDTTKLYWNVRNVRGCTVRGTNGDGEPGSLTGAWNQTSVANTGIQTSPITARTEYVLSCTSLLGAFNSSITERVIVNVIPEWYEPSGI